MLYGFSFFLLLLRSLAEVETSSFKLCGKMTKCHRETENSSPSFHFFCFPPPKWATQVPPPNKDQLILSFLSELSRGSFVGRDPMLPEGQFRQDNSRRFSRKCTVVRKAFLLHKTPQLKQAIASQTKKVKFLKPVINFFRAVLCCVRRPFLPPSPSYTNFSQKKLEKLDLVVYLS